MDFNSIKNIYNREENKNAEKQEAKLQNKNNQKMRFNLNSPDLDDTYRSISVSTSRSGLGILGFGSSARSPFLIPKNDTNTLNDILCLLHPPCDNNNENKATEIDVYEQNMEECGMETCEIFVPCADLEPVDEDVELLVPGLVDVKKKSESIGLRINNTCCVVSNGIEECIRLIPLSLARVCNDVDLQVAPKKVNSGLKNINHHVPQIEGCIMLDHKPAIFAVYFYPSPNDPNATLLEFQRRSGDTFVFQKFYDGCVEELAKTMKDLRNCADNSSCDCWNSLSLDGLSLDGDNISDTCWWDQECLNLLANLIDEDSQEAVDMLGNLCCEMEKHSSLKRQVLEHKTLMKLIITRVLTHQDQCFVTLGLIVLHMTLGGENVDLIKEVLLSYQTLAFIIALLDSASIFVLRHTVRLLALVANACACPWKLSEAQKKKIK